jgi:hypothetical protein
MTRTDLEIVLSLAEDQLKTLMQLEDPNVPEYGYSCGQVAEAIRRIQDIPEFTVLKITDAEDQT